MSTRSLTLLLVAALLVGVGGLLVALETAIGRVTRGRIEELRRDGVAAAQRLSTIIEDRARYVNVLLFLHTTATVSAIALVTAVALDEFSAQRAAALASVIAIMVVVTYVALGVAPRTLGRQQAERIALAGSGFAHAVATLLGPLASLLILVGNAVTPGKGYREGPFATTAELRELVDQAGADRLIEDDEREMIHSVFELGDTVAREVMVPRTEMVWIERTKTLRQAMSLLLRSGFSRIPVLGESADDVVGVIYLKDVSRRVFEHREAEHSERVESLMRPAYLVPDSKRVDDLLRDMQAARVHLAILVDEYGGTAGLVTIEDVLEEIVGEIADEYDVAEVPEVEELAEGSFRVSSRMHIDDFADLVGLDVNSEDEGVDTVVGFIAKRLGVVPIPGAQVDVDGWSLLAESAAGRRNRIGTVLAEPLASGDRSGPVEGESDDGA